MHASYDWTIVSRDSSERELAARPRCACHSSFSSCFCESYMTGARQWRAKFSHSHFAVDAQLCRASHITTHVWQPVWALLTEGIQHSNTTPEVVVLAALNGPNLAHSPGTAFWPGCKKTNPPQTFCKPQTRRGLRNITRLSSSPSKP